MLPPLKPDSILRSRYHILEIVGQGGMGSIYRAEDLRLEGRICAVKEILLDPLSNSPEQAQSREQFYREATILARLDHPSLPKVSDFFDEEQRDFLVMDFVPGVDLRQKIMEASGNGTYISERQIINWMTQLCDALAYLHSQTPPVLHRDIKPANIKVTPDGMIKLVDFGLVKILVPDNDRTITIVQGRGTASYTPLEQYGGDEGHTDARSDLYSLGATLYHLATNTPPVEAKLRFLHSTALVSPRSINRNLSPRLEQATLWAMEMHPDDRPPDVNAFRDLLLSTGPLSLWPAVKGQERISQIAPINRILAVAAMIMLLLAILATIFPASLPTP